MVIRSHSTTRVQRLGRMLPDMHPGTAPKYAAKYAPAHASTQAHAFGRAAAGAVNSRCIPMARPSPTSITSSRRSNVEEER
jgi:hypothetical protein